MDTPDPLLARFTKPVETMFPQQHQFLISTVVHDEIQMYSRAVGVCSDCQAIVRECDFYRHYAWHADLDGR